MIGYLKLGSEGDVYLKELTGKVKSPETVKFEQAFKSLLADFNNTKVSFETGSITDPNSGVLNDVEIMIFTTPSNERIEFSPNSFANVDFSKINVSNSDLCTGQKFRE